MNFFEHQDRARQRTTRLVILFVISVVLIVASVNLVVYGLIRAADTPQYVRKEFNPDPYGRIEPARSPIRFSPGTFAVATGLTLLIIGGGSAYKIMALSGGGPSVAQLLGGRPIDPNSTSTEEATLRNIVEEMSIASGVPMPQVYILDREDRINAFAAGFTTEDAVIGITRGAVNKLNRDELQGVIAHEFSHILNGDMRLNLQLIGALNGILVVSLIGMMILRTLPYTRRSSRNDKGAGAVLAMIVFGAALYVIGSIGVLFGKLIQAAVSRQREFLADASAVQFTRNPAGLVGALKKLGEFSSGSRVETPHAMETAHLFFANSAGMFFGNLLATHPPLIDRIRAIDPTFNAEFDRPGESDLLERYDGTQSNFQPEDRRPLAALGFINTAGQFRPAHLRRAQGLIASVPDDISFAAHEPFGAQFVVLSILASDEPAVRIAQFNLLQRHIQPEIIARARELAAKVHAMNSGTRLALFDISLPALRKLSEPQVQQFRAAARQMIETDRKVTLFEYALHRMLEMQLPLPGEQQPRVIEFFAISTIRDDAAVLLSALASASSTETLRAFQLAAKQLDPDAAMEFAKVSGLGAIDQALSRIARASPAVKKRVMDAAACAVAVDGEINVSEAELLRATAAALGVPLPPLVTERPDAA